MTAILVCTHGDSARELVKSAEMICGQQSNWGTVAFKVGMDPDQLTEQIKEHIRKLDVSTGLLCLTDLKGGTPFNVLVRLSQAVNLEVLTGVNIPMLIEAAMAPGDIAADAMAKKLLATGKASMYIYQKDEVQAPTADEEF